VPSRGLRGRRDVSPAVIRPSPGGGLAQVIVGHGSRHQDADK
jgi:hypothetical protein